MRLSYSAGSKCTDQVIGGITWADEMDTRFTFPIFDASIEVLKSNPVVRVSQKTWHSGGERGRLFYINLSPNTDAAKKISSHTAF